MCIRLNILFLTILFHLGLSRDRCWRHWQGHSELITQRTEYNDWYSNRISWLLSIFDQLFLSFAVKNLLIIRSFATISFFFVMFALTKFHWEKNDRIGAPSFGNWIPFQSKHYLPIMSVRIQNCERTNFAVTFALQHWSPLKGKAQIMTALKEFHGFASFSLPGASTSERSQKEP